MATPTLPHEYDEYSNAQRWIILFAVMLGTLMMVIDSSIVNVAIPTMMGNLGATITQITWVSTGYIIANVIMLPLTGWLSSHFGRRRYLAFSMVLFTVASFFCGTSHTLGMLVFFRVLQGVGGAALLTVAQATMMEIFPPQQLGMVQAIYGVGVMVGPTIGPTLGGWITDNYNWPWIFFINLPIGILATVLTLMFTHDSKFKRDTSAGVDFTGIALLAIGLGSLQYMLEKGNSEGWFDSPMIIELAISAALGITAFIVWELRSAHPAVNLRILKNRGFAAGTLYAAVLGVGLYGGIFILPVFLQELRHYTAMQTGLIMLPGAIATTISMPIVGKLVSRYPARNLVGIGGVLFIISTFMLMGLTTDSGPESMFWSLVLRGSAMGFLFVPMTLAALAGLRGHDIADGTGLYGLARQLGGSVGIALLSTVIDHRAAFHRAMLLEHINAFNPLSQQRVLAYQYYFNLQGSPMAVAKQQAYALIDGIISGQAAVMAFNDGIFLIAIIFIATLPLLLLFNRGIPGAANKKERAMSAE